MSLRLMKIAEDAGKVNASRDEILKLLPEVEFGEWKDVEQEDGSTQRVFVSDGRTKQSFKDSTDINKMLSKAQTAGSIAHLQKYPELIYGEFDGEVDLLTAHSRIEKATQIFNELPSEIRNEFNNKPLDFVAFANDPNNKGKMAELLPAIAKPGSYFPNPVKRGGQGAGAATAPAEEGSSPPETPPAAGSPTGEGGTDG